MLKEHKERRVLQAYRVPSDRMVRRVSPGRRGHAVRQAHRVRKVRKVRKVHRVPPDSVVQRASKVLRGSLALRVLPACKVLPVYVVKLGSAAIRAFVGTRACKVLQAFRARKV